MQTASGGGWRRTTLHVGLDSSPFVQSYVPKLREYAQLKGDCMSTSTTGKTNPITEQSGWRRQMQNKRIKFDDEQKKIYCEHLAACGLKTVAALKAGVAYATVTAHIKNDPDFAQAVDEAWAARTADVVIPLEEQALKGHEERTIHGTGENQVERIRTVFETPLRVLQLKKYDREGYGDKVAVEHSGSVGGGVLMVPMVLTKEEWIAAYSPKEAPPPPDEEEA